MSANEAPDSEEQIARSRNLKKDYQALISDFKTKGEVNMNACDDKAEELFKKIENPSEALYDAKYMDAKLTYLNQRVQAIDTGLKFDSEEFASKLKVAMNKENNTNPYSNFLELGKISQNIISMAPSLFPMYGCFDKQYVPQKKDRPVKEKDKTGELKKPMVVSTSTNPETSEISEKILSILTSKYMKNGNKPISFFPFVTNPHSYTETVENIYYVSILVKEGTVKLEYDDESFPILTPITSSESLQQKKLQKKTRNIILTMTEELYLKTIKYFNIKKAMIVRKN